MRTCKCPATFFQPLFKNCGLKSLTAEKSCDMRILCSCGATLCGYAVASFKLSSRDCGFLKNMCAPTSARNTDTYSLLDLLPVLHPFLHRFYLFTSHLHVMFPNFQRFSSCPEHFKLTFFHMSSPTCYPPSPPPRPN